MSQRGRDSVEINQIRRSIVLPGQITSSHSTQYLKDFSQTSSNSAQEHTECESSSLSHLFRSCSDTLDPSNRLEVFARSTSPYYYFTDKDLFHSDVRWR